MKSSPIDYQFRKGQLPKNNESNSTNIIVIINVTNIILMYPKKGVLVEF